MPKQSAKPDPGEAGQKPIQEPKDIDLNSRNLNRPHSSYLNSSLTRFKSFPHNSTQLKVFCGANLMQLSMFI